MEDNNNKNLEFNQPGHEDLSDSAKKLLGENAVLASEDAVQEVLEKYDKEALTRKNIVPNFWNILIVVTCITFSLFQLWSATQSLPPQILRPAHLAFTLFLIFLLYPTSRKMNRQKMNPMDIALAILGATVGLYAIFNYQALILRGGSPTTIDMAISLLTILLVLESTRRIIGIPIVIVAIVFILYAGIGPRGFLSFLNVQLPGIFAHRGFTFERMLNHMYMTTEGIFGAPLGVSATFVFLFILFGAFLHKTGLGKFFIDIALAATGSKKGGPAKVAVVASGLFGTISGSSVANTVTTGTFTIPLMKSIGYKPYFAGAVEAAASTGGQIMPPIMGAAAFIMAETTGIPYGTIALAAVLPALLYYLAIFVMIHMEAVRLDLQGLPKESLPHLGTLMRENGHLLMPIIVIIYMLIMGYTATLAALVSIAVSILSAMLGVFTYLALPIFLLFYKYMPQYTIHCVAGIATIALMVNLLYTRKLKFKDFLAALEEGARAALGVAAACACAGIIVGVVTLTGLGLKLANGIVMLAGGSLFFTLVLTMIASIILGMGLPTTAKYIILSAMAAPAIIKLTAPDPLNPLPQVLLAAHMFIFYFGIVADLTPPVALAAYAGAGIAGANPMKTGFTALRLAIAGFLIPYIFVYNPQLLLMDLSLESFMAILLPICTAIAGTVLLAFASAGYWLRPLDMPERLILAAGAICLISPDHLTDLIGIAIAVLIYLFQKFVRKDRGLFAFKTHVDD